MSEEVWAGASGVEEVGAGTSGLEEVGAGSGAPGTNSGAPGTNSGAGAPVTNSGGVVGVEGACGGAAGARAQACGRPRRGEVGLRWSPEGAGRMQGSRVRGRARGWGRRGRRGQQGRRMPGADSRRDVVEGVVEFVEVEGGWGRCRPAELHYFGLGRWMPAWGLPN